MTVQIPATRHDEIAMRLATTIEERLAGLADELEHAGVELYDTDRGLATRGGVVRMSLADLAAIAAEAALAAPPLGPGRPDAY
ncbi:MAG TPA: hypothetical protein VFH03_01070 [Actinoplanes sp.]|nr:hypothetical protein [Actinoplanes sp.]